MSPQQVQLSHSGAAACADFSPSVVDEPRPFQPIFPPRDADVETRRKWLAATPWPEVLFASAS